MAKKRGGLDLPKAKTFVGPAQLWKRAIAFILDLLILDLLVLWPFRGVFRSLMGDSKNVMTTYRALESSAGMAQIIFMVFVLAFVFVLIYFVVMDYLFGQTIGMMIFKLKVVAKDTKPGFFQCLLRNIFILPFFPFLVLWIVDPAFAIFTKTHQRLTEKLSKTFVVETYAL